MEKLTIDDVERSALGDGIECRGLSEPLGTTDVVLNHYRIPPGEGFPGGLHTHMDQEEVFVVIEGEATFETLASQGVETGSEGGEITVGEREAIRFAPGEFQSGKNDSDRELVVVAIGAPRDSEDVRIPVNCPNCGHDNLRLVFDENGVTFVCPGCNVAHIPRDCPECGHDDLRVTLGTETRTVVVCRECEANSPHRRFGTDG